MIVKPFRGWRPAPELSERMPSYPYDVVNSSEAREIAAGEPYSFLRVVKAEIELEPDIDIHDDRVYQKARETLLRWMDAGRLLRDARPAYYVYRLEMDGQAQVGILGAAALADYTAGRIKKHEATRPEKLEDRIRLNDTLGVNPGPVFLTYRPLPELNAVVNGIVARDAPVDFTAPDGIRHSLWVVDEPATAAKIEELFAKVRATYIADGHHRTEAAARVAERRIKALESPTGREPCHFFLAAHFPADQVRVLDYNRVVKDLNGLDLDGLLERIDQAGFHVKKNHLAKRPPHRETIGMYVAGGWYLLTPRTEIVPRGDVVGRLDVSILTDNLLQPVLGIGDPRTDKRIDSVGGIRGMRELERRVDSGEEAVAFALFPTSLEEVMSVADANRMMPPKSTWFEPKLRSGMVVQSLEGDTL